MNGIINVLKPPHTTSSDAVVFLKKVLGVSKIGHMGTLDPGAAGVLLIGVGKSARLFPYLLNSKKFYRAIFRFSLSTDTIDSYGKIIGTNGYIPKEEAVLKALKGFVGEIMQRPPKYSAVNIDGKRAYDKARADEDFEINPKKVFIEKFDLVNRNGEFFEFDIVCGSGTYIRSLCFDLAELLKTKAYMASLIRMSSGNFKIEDSYSLDEIESIHKNSLMENILVKPEDALSFIEKINLEEKECFKLLNGVSVETGLQDGEYRVFTKDAFIGVAATTGGFIKMKTLLN